MTSSGNLLYNKRRARKIERWKSVLKDYVTKTLAFLQMPGKAQRAQGKQGPSPAGRQEENPVPESGAAETAVETDFDPEALFADPTALEERSEASPAEAQEEPSEEGLEETLEEPPVETPAEDLETATEAPPLENSEEAPAEDLAETVPGQASFEEGLRSCESRNYPQALEAFTQAAGLGHMQAQFLCGQMYQQGVAAGPDHKQALAWYKRAAKQGFMEAQLACGAMYEEGRGTAVNMKRALGWYEQAARQGSLKAQLKCGRMYFCGRAETRNPKKARYWLEIAAESGSEEARQLLSQRF